MRPRGREREMHESLKRIGEFGFIGRIARTPLFRPSGVIQGIGDDASVFEPPEGKVMVLTTDMLVEGVHFWVGVGLELVGRKSLAVNLSDIAAMGAEPLDAYVSIGVSQDITLADLEEFYRGLCHVAREHRVNILGGDTTRSPGPLIVSIAVTGCASKEEIVLREGASPGDLIYVTGFLGDSAAGLDLLRRKRPWPEEKASALLKAHLDPRPHIEEGRFLAKSGWVRAMMDVSDGVASDLRHICARSSVGAVLREEWIPMSGAFREYCERFSLDPLELALGGGEDYCLLVALSRDAQGKLEEEFERKFKRPIWKIGEITSQKDLLVIRKDGRTISLPEMGWDSFRDDRF
jgi:thiamine-monophosphate kinase